MATTQPLLPPEPRTWTDAEFARMQQLGLFAGRGVELVAGVVRERGTGSPFVFTRKKYYALDANQFFRDQCPQLIGGVILKEVAVTTPRNATAVCLATRVVNRIFGAGHDVRCRLPINLGLVSEPEPDVAVVIGSPRDYLADHPKCARLIVEVGDATIDLDTYEKAQLYASGGIADYWVVNLTTDRVHVFRAPRPDAASRFGHDYGSLSSYGRDDTLTPLAAPNAHIRGSDLLP